MAFIRNDDATAVREATDIVALVQEHLNLRHRGKEFVGLCPFHDDSKPSMYVSPQKQIFKCFACGAGGSVFDWMMRYHRMSFVEALKFLADRAGITLQSRQRDEAGSDEPTDRQRISAANEKALSFFRKLYRHPDHGRTAREYVQGRGISDDMIEAFALGYAPDRWDGLAMTIDQKGWPRGDFELAGLVSERHQGGGWFDRLRHRLIFPICDSLGRPIAFGGRVLAGSTREDKSDAKYLNSPEHALFNKSATLYGLHLAKKPIIDSGTVVIVEGYTDVIACHQAGHRNVVATLGTALTELHARELRKYAEKIVLIFDGDEAGQKAADRAIEVFFAGELDVYVAVIPGGQDPADLFAQGDGHERWATALATAEDALAFQFARIRGRFDAADTLAGRQRVIEEYMRQIASAGLTRANALRRGMIVQRLSELLPITEQQINTMLREHESRQGKRVGGAGIRGAHSDDPARSADPRTGSPAGGESDNLLAQQEMGPRIRRLRVAEQQLIGGLIRQPGLFHLVLSDGRSLDEAVMPDDLISEQARFLYRIVHDRLAEDAHLSIDVLTSDLAMRGHAGLCDWITSAESMVEQQTDGDDDILRQVVSDAAAAIRGHHHDKEDDRARQALSGVMVSGADAATQEQARLLRQVHELRRGRQSPLTIARVGGGSGSGFRVPGSEHADRNPEPGTRNPS